MFWKQRQSNTNTTEAAVASDCNSGMTDILSLNQEIYEGTLIQQIKLIQC